MIAQSFGAMVTRREVLCFLSVGFLFLVRTSLCIRDTIASGESLSADRTLVSKGGVFELGFFTQPPSLEIYVGIWYKNLWERIVVWVANRDKPLTNASSSRLILSQEGNLHLMESEIQVWSTNLTSNIGNSTVAVLLDDGNLVLRDGSNSSSFIWQSFDHPTSGGLVPGARLRFNKQTKASQVITAWKSRENPGEGMFSFGIDPDGSQLYLEWNKSQRYWTSGAWNGHFFSQVSEMRLKESFNFSFLSNENETFFTYSVNDTSIYSVLGVDTTGELKLLTWLKGVAEEHVSWSQPMQKCEIYGVCGSFGTCLKHDSISCACLDGFEPHFQGIIHDWYKGCARRTPLKCKNKTPSDGKEDDFLLQSKIRLPANAQTLTVSGAQQCKLACLNKCSCTAYNYDNSQCLIWNGELFNLQKFNDFNVRCPSSSQPLNWDPDFYDELQNQIGGGKPKMRWYFKEHGWPSSSIFEAPPEDDAKREMMIDTIQDWKTERYKEIIKSGTVKPRPGVLRLMDEVKAAGIKVAVCSAATKSSVILCLESLIGIERFQGLDCFLAGDDVQQKKPDPSIYVTAAKKLGVPERNCLVVEDSIIGLQAATRAGMSCVVTYTSSTANQDFKDAIAIYPDLGNVRYSS